jgi:hypothetical protein
MTDKIRKHARQATSTKTAAVDDVKANTLRAPALAGKSRERAIAELALNPVMANASTARTFAKSTYGTIDLTESLSVMREKAERVKAGDLTEAEVTLMAQAVALDAIFTELARRAALNMGEYMSATETYLRLALKAQSQCRATLETLAEIKNPRAVAFVKQANIAHGAQQVNNGVSTPADTSRTEKSANPSNELSGASHELLPDTRTPAHAGAVNPQLETVGAIHGAAHTSGQSKERGQ